MRCLSYLTTRNSWHSAALVAAAVFTLSACDDIMAPEFGTLRVNVVTDGEDMGTSYALTVGDEPAVNIGVNVTALLLQVPVGSHEIQLSGLRSNCSTVSPTVTVEVLKESIAVSEFRIACVARNGSINFSVITTGSALDPDGFAIMIDGVAASPVNNNAQVTIAGVREGIHQLRLSGLEPNCSGGGAVTRTVSFGTMTDVQFAIVCAAVGSVRVSVSSVGQSVDVNGYRVRVGSRSFAIASSGTVVVDTIAIGTHAVSLEDVAANCVVASPDVRDASVSLNQTTQVQFSVTCQGVGSIAVTTVTNGSNLDPDGYAIILDDVQARTISNSGQVAIAGVATGTHRVRLAGLAPNCFGGDEVTRTVSADLVISIQFLVVCVGPSGAVVVSVTTTGPSPDPNGYRISIGLRTLTVASGGSVTFESIAAGFQQVRLEDVSLNCELSGPVFKNVNVVVNGSVTVEFNLSCTPATMIAYAAQEANNWDIYVALSNGGGITRLTTDAGRDLEPAWSRDGRIAFASERAGNFEIYVMNADGTNQTRLTNDVSQDMHPTWSPDGSKIAFISMRDGNAEIYMMNSDGSGAQRVTSNSVDDGDPTWSPDGARLAFTRKVGAVQQLHVMNIDGTGVVRLSNSGEPESGPAWSRDGSMLAVVRLVYYYGDNWEISILRSDGTGPNRWIAYGESPTWSPDGRWIAYSRSGLLATDDFAQRNVNIVAGTMATPAWRW